jgi:putative ABC transport system permease protein
MLERLRLRVRALVRFRAMEHELEDELRYHLERETERNIASGMSPADAAVAARRAFGNSTQLREQVRDSWGRRWIERLEQDTRFAFRSFRRTPVFSFTVVGTIALALGLNTTAFTIFDAYVLRPLAVRDPASLFRITWADRGGSIRNFSWRDYQALHADRDAFSEAFGERFVFTRLDSTPAYGQLVTGNYFTMLGVGAALGRTLLPSDATPPGGPPVVVLSHHAWQSQFGSDSAILGKTIRVRGHALRVVGVAAPGFGGLVETPLDFWAPLTINDLLFPDDSLFGSRDGESLQIIGRLRPGLTVGEGEAWVTTWMRGRRVEARDRDQPVGSTLDPRATAMPLTSEFALFFSPIAAAFLLVLLIACADVANMMLARGMARQREIGIRLSLGAARSRLIAQLLTESVLLAVPAALLGFAISRFTIDGGVRLMFATLPAEIAPYMRVMALTPDARVFVFMLVAAIGSALLFGLAPALQSTRPSVVQATRGDFDTAFRPQRLRNALVVGQITVCLLLLICAGILLRGVGRLQQLDIGLRTQGVVRLDLQERPGVRDAVLAALRARPDVRLLAAATDSPFGRRFPTVTALDSSGHARATFYDFVSASYFPLLEIPIVRGRRFTEEEERSGALVAIVSEGTARAFWPDRDPIGQALTLALDTLDHRMRALASHRVTLVIGVVPNVALGTLIDPFDSPAVYFPVAPSVAGSALLVRVSGAPDLTMRRIDAALAQTIPSSIEEIHTLDAYLGGGLYPFRAAYWIAGVLGAIALLLTVAGVYGVLSYVVAQRRKELGIRLALGATPGAVTGLVLGQSMRLAAIGLALGCLLSLGVARIFAANIVRLSTFEPMAFGGGTILVLLSCVVASYVPSRRASRVDPAEALRSE